MKVKYILNIIKINIRFIDILVICWMSREEKVLIKIKNPPTVLRDRETGTKKRLSAHFLGITIGYINPATKRQICATRKVTTKPIASGRSAETVVHRLLPVSL